MPSSLPSGDPAPADGALPGDGRWPSWAPARSGSTCTCRSARCGAATATSTPTPPPSSATSPAPRARRTPRPAIAEVRLARRVLGDRDLPVADRLLRRRYADAAPGGRPGVGPGAPSPRSSGSPRRRGHHRGQPRQRDRRGPPGAARGRLHPAELRHAVGRRPRARHPRPHPRPARVPAVVDWAREAGFEQVSLDLIYGTPGESLDDWGLSLETRPGLPPRPRVGVLPHRRARHRPRPPDHAAASSRHPTTTTSPTSTCSPTSAEGAGLRLVRGLQLGRRPAARCRHNELYWTGGRLVGDRPGCAQPRRRGAMVERQAPLGVRRAAGRRAQPGRRARDARRRDPPGRAGPARDPAPRWAAGPHAGRPWSRSGRPAGRPGTGRARAPNGWC